MRPSSVQVSIGTAAVLGLANVLLETAPTTAYLMLGGRCLLDCAFCAQARGATTDPIHLSRVTWPEYNLDEVTGRLAQAVGRGALRRACLQVTATRDAFEGALEVLRRVRAASDLPFDVAILPHNLDRARQLVSAGADHIGFGLDAACERVFRQVKGGDWSRSLSLVAAAAEALPGHVALHLIVGLGETERELVERIQWAHDRGITVGLFAFTPVPGTRLAGREPPPLPTYRRMQAARWLIAGGAARAEAMSFDAEGRLTGLGAALPGNGEPFRTSGCPDCNRPYYNERPGGTLYNYPRPLTAEEAAQAMRELELAADQP